MSVQAVSPDRANRTPPERLLGDCLKQSRAGEGAVRVMCPGQRNGGDDWLDVGPVMLIIYCASSPRREVSNGQAVTYGGEHLRVSDKYMSVRPPAVSGPAKMLAHSHWPALALTFDEAAGTLQQRPGLASRAAIFIVHRSRPGEQLLSAFRRFGTFTLRYRCGRVPEAEIDGRRDRNLHRGGARAAVHGRPSGANTPNFPL